MVARSYRSRHLECPIMAKMGTDVAIGSLVAAISFATPGTAFALRLGPFHLGLPFFGHAHAHRHQARPHSEDHAGVAYNATGNPEAVSKAATGPASALLNPGLALPAIYDDVFWPGRHGPSAMTRSCKRHLARRTGTGIVACVKPIADRRSSSTLQK